VVKDKKSKYPPEELEREGRMVREAIKNSSVKLSQEKCMGLLGISQANMSQWLNGTERMSGYNLVFLGSTYNFDVTPIRESLKLYRDYFVRQALRDGIRAHEHEILSEMAASIKPRAPATANQVSGVGSLKPRKGGGKLARQT